MKLKMGHFAQIVGLGVLMGMASYAAETAGSAGLTITNGTKIIDLPKVSGVDEFKVLRSTNLAEGFREIAPGAISGYHWQQPGQGELEFFKVEMQPKDLNALLNATLLNRIAYGQTPDELERLAQIGPDGFIQEQLAPELIEENLEIDKVEDTSGWQYVTLTGTATSSRMYLYIANSRGGDCFIDDIKLVPGDVPEAGANAVINGDFENGLSGWSVSTNVQSSIVRTDIKHSGNAALHLISSDDLNESQESSIWRSDLGLRTGQPYTLSYWYKAGTNKLTQFVIRLSGGNPGTGEIYSVPGNIATRLADGTASLNDLAGWHALHAIQSKKQLLEVMLQFLENHFVTQHRKSREYMDGRLPSEEAETVATSLEYREMLRWRQALLDPNCTFYDLLKLSAESPAMIIYLDTVNSRGDGTRIANENYARELLELFTFGVDNGYDQNDITIMSRAWTGWSVQLVDYSNEFNPFAPLSTIPREGATNMSRPDNLEGIWAFNYNPGRHSAGPKVIFPGKTVPARFGAPYAGRDYELRLNDGLGTNWQYVTQTGTASSQTLYMYNTGTGDCYIDDIKLVAGSVPEAGPNLLANGDFENGLTGWTVSANMTDSTTTGGLTHAGTSALHMVDTSAEGTSRAQSIWRGNLGLTMDQPYTLSYWYLPGTNMNGNLVIRLSGSGIVSTPGTGTNSIQEAYEVIQHLADQPFTQEYISVKLCRLLVHDDFRHGYNFIDPNLSPEGRLVRDCMTAWENGSPKGQIREVLAVILNSELFRSQAASAQKIKTPFEFTVSAIRALRARMEDGSYTANSDSTGNGIRNPINRMGRMRLFDREEPDGYPEAGAPWISAGTLTERLRFIQALLATPTESDAAGNDTDPVRLMKSKLPASSWTDPLAVADYFTKIIFPGEGRANLDEYRQMAGWYLNTGDNGGAGTEFSALDPNGPRGGAYDLRVRGMVAMLMTYPRFQEQ